MLFQARFRQHLQQAQLVCPGDTIIVAVSGGADSMALLCALYDARREWGLKLIVAHYDHHLRRSSVRDRVFVQKAAQRLGLIFITEVNRRAVPKTGSIEEFAREQRYEFLFRNAKKYNADAVVTAHTRDDLAETILMRILRGTGLLGLQAILPRRRVNGIELVRPLLIFSRQDVEGFLKETKVRFIQDPTNRSLDFTRNKVRRVLIPYLEKEFHPGIKDNLARLADTAAGDYAFIEEIAGRFLKKSLKTSSGMASLPLNAFKRLPSSLRRMVLRAAYSALFGDTKPLTLAHIDAMDRIACDERRLCQKGKTCLPGGIVCARSGLKLVLKINRSS